MANIEGISPRPAPPAAPDAPSWITPAEILESIGEAFYAIDRQWRFVYVNATAERLWGRNRHDLLGHVSTEVFPMWVGTASHRAHQKVLETGEAISLKTHLSANGLPVELN
ncbi:MAG: PAS domain-containing protein, partial [Pseudolabrys sp.]|nr:PAS domain-containing protein [Pseudolabrys sp.]